MLSNYWHGVDKTFFFKLRWFTQNVSLSFLHQVLPMWDHKLAQGNFLIFVVQYWPLLHMAWCVLIVVAKFLLKVLNKYKCGYLIMWVYLMLLALCKWFLCHCYDPCSSPGTGRMLTPITSYHNNSTHLLEQSTIFIICMTVCIFSLLAPTFMKCWIVWLQI